jgi:hypothetical protein
VKTLTFKLFFVVSLFPGLLLVSCGKKQGPVEKCLSREAKRLECRADLAASRYYSSQYQIDLDEANCNRIYNITACYKHSDDRHSYLKGGY